MIACNQLGYSVFNVIRVVLVKVFKRFLSPIGRTKCDIGIGWSTRIELLQELVSFLKSLFLRFTLKCF